MSVGSRRGVGPAQEGQASEVSQSLGIGGWAPGSSPLGLTERGRPWQGTHWVVRWRERAWGSKHRASVCSQV